MTNPNRVSKGVPTGGQFAAGAKAEADMALEQSEETTFGGSGWDDYTPGEPVVSVDDVKTGDLLTNEDHRFGLTRNLVKVTRVDTGRRLIHGVFVDPADAARLRMSDDQEFAVWEHGLEDSAYHHATSTTRPSLPDYSHFGDAPSLIWAKTTAGRLGSGDRIAHEGVVREAAKIAGDRRVTWVRFVDKTEAHFSNETALDVLRRDPALEDGDDY